VGGDDVAFSRDGRKLVAVGVALRLFDIASRRAIGDLPSADGVDKTASFSPDGTQVVAGADDGTVRVWDIRTSRRLPVLRRHDGAVESVQFSPDGRWILSAADDGTVRVWDAGGRAQPIDLADGLMNPVAAFGPDGRHVIVGGGDVRILDCSVCAPLNEVLDLARKRATRQLTREERATYLP
jgi:WD40 repeat protein